MAVGVLAFMAGCLPPDDPATGVTGASGNNGGQAGAGGSTSGAGGDPAGSGGSTSGAAGDPTGTGGSPAAGTGGSTPGAGGIGGSSAGGGGQGGTGGSAGQGGTAGRGGQGGAAGRGGGTAGQGGTAGRGGTGGTAGAAGRGGTGGAAGAAGAGAGDVYVSGVTITVHAQTRTILVVNWTQAMAAEQTFLEFTYAGGPLQTSRAKPGTTGAHRDVVLGVPASTAVTVRIVSRQGGVDYKTRDYMGTTGALPTTMPLPTILSYDASIASRDRWMFGAVENSDGGCTNTSCYYHTTFYLYIMDRQGRIVWYYADAASNATSSFQRIARDGEYIWIEKRPFSGGGTRSVLKMTLDREYSEMIPVSGLADCIDVTDDGSLLYDASNELREMNRAGTVRTIWSCRTAFGTNFRCYSNTINWNPADNTVLMSFPDENTVAQINRATGALVATYGDRSGSYTFSPTTWSFEFQHFPNITADGTLIVSSHMPQAGTVDGTRPVAMGHAFMEFTIDRTNRRLVEKWIYNAGPEWAMYKGMAIRLPNGNTLGNYGTGGFIREITPDKRTAFHVKFDAPSGNDNFNKMVGHNVLIDDLYALNGGGPR
jgi:hypothetical protein